MCAMSMYAQEPVLNETYLKYIEKYKKIALEQEKVHKIPACITLAQGLLESGAGQSELAVKANNHFGIKCHKEWTGATYSHDDETRDECFRKYHFAKESYEDHSKFLLRPRYASLFELSITDYKGWAHGLRRCGYATDPTYAAKLIKLIEDYGLASIGTQVDDKKEAVDTPAEEKQTVQEETQVAGAALATTSEKPAQKKNTKVNESSQTAQSQARQQEKIKKEQSAKPVKEKEVDEEAGDDIIAKSLGGGKQKVAATMGELSLFSEHKVYSEKFVRWVIAEQGDTYESIGYEFNIEVSRLRKYNNADKGGQPETGQKVYLTRHK